MDDEPIVNLSEPEPIVTDENLLTDPSTEVDINPHSDLAIGDESDVVAVPDETVAAAENSAEVVEVTLDPVPAKPFIPLPIGERYRPARQGETQGKRNKLWKVSYAGSTDIIEAEDECHARRIRTGDGDGPPPKQVECIEVIDTQAS